MTKLKKNSSNNALLALSNSIVITQFFDMLDINYTVLDRNGNYLVYNNKILDVVGENIKNAKEIDEKSWLHCQETMRIKEKTIVEECYKDKFFLSMKFPILDKTECIGILVISSDITEKKKLELMKHQFIQNMEHDLKTPCSSIYGISELLKTRVKDIKIKEMCEWMATSAKQLMNVISEICKFNIITSKINYEVFNLRDIFETVYELHSATIHFKNLNFSSTIPNVYLFSDKFRVHEILSCLLGNAVKFTEKGDIHVQFNKDNEFLKVEFRDTGIGIPKEEMDFIFKDFTKLSPSNKHGDNFQGAGLGLHIAKTFARDLGGDITVDSEVTKGAVFTLVLPLSCEKAEY